MNSNLHPNPDDRNARSRSTTSTRAGMGGADARTGTQRILLPHHLAELATSGLSPETIAANSVYSESDPAAVAALLNWSATRTHALGPVLVYPHFDRAGNPLGHATVKPDHPRARANKPDKPTKYENPYRRPNRLYIPAGTRPALADPIARLLITEGCKKALAATQHAFACVSLPGVWNWVAPRPTKDGKKIGRTELMPDLAAVAWAGRPVFVVYDSDAATNPDVARAERALADALRGRGAVVRVVRLPAESDGTKNGLDDFLVRHGSDALRALLDPPPPQTLPTPSAVDPTDFTESGYKADRGWTFHCVLSRDKESGDLVVEKQTKLANFTARITGERVTDDGAEQTREFVIAVEQRGRPAVSAGVPVERFAALDWVVERFGPRFVIQAGSGKRDHLRCAIQEMSGDDIPSATVYTHTGWREVGGRWLYLHAGGAVAPDVTPSANVEVRLDGAAAGFRLPAPPTGTALRDAVRASLRLLDRLAPDAVTFPILASVYRAVLGGADYAVWLSGSTGVKKSELAALAQQHFGPSMSRNRLPGNWSSTDNALEGLAFAAKDALLVVDDFAPSAARADAERQQRAAERLIRGQGNHAGRQRMRADGTLRPPKPPRCLVLATGEDVPKTQSITARLCVVAVRTGDVAVERLSACQKDAAGGLYAAAVAGFVAWLAPWYADTTATLDAERVELRDRFVGRCPHARTPDIVANLLLGLRYLLRFAEAAGAIDAREREALWGRGEAAFRALADAQGEHLRATDPVARFPEMLAAVLGSGRGHLAGPDGQTPGASPSPEAWGWETRESRNGFGDPRAAHQGRGRKVGWVTDDALYLDPDSVYAALTELARDQGQVYPVTQQTLSRRLNESGLLARTDTGRTTYPVTLEGVRRRVLVLAPFILLGKPGRSGHSGHNTENAGDSVPVSCPDFPPSVPKPGHETGTKTLEKPAFVPTVPVVPVSGTREGAGGNPAGPEEALWSADDVEVFAP